jgi:predicted membrane channel-forming protein YqfA (hemolysin III family)
VLITHKFAPLVAIAIIHVFMVIIHGTAHLKLPVPISVFQAAFVVIVILLAPIVAIYLLQTPWDRVGIWLWLFAMLGALIFNHFYHLIQVSSDNLSQIPATQWGEVFRVTAISLEAIEGLGCIVAIALIWQQLHRHKTELSQ